MGRTRVQRPTGGGSPPPGWPGSKLSVGEGDKLREQKVRKGEIKICKTFIKIQNSCDDEYYQEGITLLTFAGFLFRKITLIIFSSAQDSKSRLFPSNFESRSKIFFVLFHY